MVLAHDINQGLRTQDVKISEDVTFDSMLLAHNTLQGLRSSGFYKPSPIQLHGIPMGKCGFDLILEAKSGTGKTAVFTVIALEKLDIDKGLQVLILAPTREIASQICDVIIQIGVNYEGLTVEVVMGGLPVQDDISKFKKHVHIVVGSPGRLRHLIQDNHIDISAVRLLVLDEADKLVEKSFQSDINYIFSILPKQKQVIMSSATYPEVSKSFIHKYVNNAQYICPDSNSVLLGIEQKLTIVKYNSNIVRQTQYRFEELLKIFSKIQFKQCLIFCNYQARIGELHKMLTREKWPAEQLYGQQEQLDRLGALKTLQEYKCRILISTDLAARGIDASNVDLVINFEPPFEWQIYLHRIGRAGRFGAYGIAITMLSEGKEEIKFKEVLESSHIPFVLKKLWNDSKFCIQNLSLPKNMDISNQSHTQKENKNIEELWNSLTCKSCENLDCIKEIINFENLCESFANSNTCNVESFSDLLGSFQNRDETTNESGLYQYKNMNIKQLNIDEYFNNIPNYKTILETKELCTISQVQTEIKHNGFSNIAKSDQKIDKIHFYNRNNSSHVFTKNECQNEFNELKVQTINVNSMEHTLQAAGLPTCFSSSKNKPKTKKYVKTRRVRKNDNQKRLSDQYDVAIQELYEQKVQKKSTRKTGTSSKSKESVKKNIETINPVGDTETYEPAYNATPSQNNRHTNVVHNKCRHKRSTNAHHFKNINDEKLKINFLDKSKQDKTNTGYTIWYNRLKNHIKGLEYAMYIDEISKI